MVLSVAEDEDASPTCMEYRLLFMSTYYSSGYFTCNAVPTSLFM